MISEIKLIGLIGEKFYRSFNRNIEEAVKNDTKDLDLLIISPGGSLNYSLKITEIIINCGILFTGYGVMVSSGAFIIHQACWPRISYLDSTFLIHRAISTKTNTLVKNPLSLMAEQGMFEYIAERSKKSVSEIYDMANQSKKMKGLEAKELGFVDMLLQNSYGKT